MTTLKRIGILGCGGIMQTIYSPIILSLSDQVQVAAFCDLNPLNLQRASHLFPNATVYQDAEQMLTTAELDAVMVLTSERVNAKMAELSLRAGITTYLEKPPAVSLTEFDALLETEALSTARLFSAFNRRHTPLLRHFKLPASPLKHVQGGMQRLGRHVPSFPSTAIHVIDSVQYFAGQSFAEAHILFEQNTQARWTINGIWSDGATCTLHIVPDGVTHYEQLVFEGKDYSWEVEFPNREGRIPDGKFVQKSGSNIQVITDPGAKGNYLEQMGYAPAFRGFLRELDSKETPSPAYRLAASRSTISIMDVMLLRKKSAVWFGSSPCLSV
jgi:virulence factor